MQETNIKKKRKRWQCLTCKKDYVYIKSAMHHMIKTGHKKYKELY